MRLVLLFLIAFDAWAQGPPGSETVIPRVDDESIYAHLYEPAAEGRHAAMVLVHGFDGVSDAREGFWARELAALGIATLKASGVMRRDCVKARATTAADARTKRQAPEDVKAFLKGRLL